MKLEEEIQQEKFRSEYQKLGINITYTHFWLTEQMNSILKPAGLSVQQFNVLRILRGQYPKPSTVNLLKERMLDKNSDASRLVKRLRTKGLVNYFTCPADRRSVDVVISDEGLALLNKIDSRQGALDNFCRNLSEQEAHKANQLLDKLRG
jgi:DNA-binding MarR family transcriptional regulator